VEALLKPTDLEVGTLFDLTSQNSNPKAEQSEIMPKVPN